MIEMIELLIEQTYIAVYIHLCVQIIKLSVGRERKLSIFIEYENFRLILYEKVRCKTRVFFKYIT